MDRKTLFEYADKQFGAKPEYLWSKLPDYAVLRHTDNHKWFAILMKVPGSKLGLKNNDLVDIIDLKAHPLQIDAFKHKEGIFPAYHMNKEHWMSVALWGSVPPKEIYKYIDDSYTLTR